jgi:ABC-type transporter Mla MlaB component
MSSERRAGLRDMGDIPTTVVLVAADGTEEVVGRVEPGRADLATVDALVRFQLVARRAGGRVRVDDASDELRDLLELAGLAEVLGLEPRRKPELLEQLGIEEVMQAGDPPA